MQTQIQKMNDRNFVHPIVIGIQITSLTVVAKLATTKVLIQRASTLLRMSLNQNSILRKRWMIRQDQEHQRFLAIWIMFNLIGLQMRRRNNLVTLGIVMNDSFPSWNLTLTEFWYSSSGSITAFNHRKRFFRSKFLTGWNIDAVVMCDLTEVDVPLTDCQRIQSFERRCISSKVAFLNVGLKHEPA